MGERSHEIYQEEISLTCNNFRDFLLEKNKRYKSSVFHPLNALSKADAETAIKVRIDDKLMRIINSGELRKNDIADLHGYLALLMVEKRWNTFEDLID